MSPKHKRQQPKRCLVCGERKGSEDQVRLLADPAGGLVVDLKGKLGGRGAFVCLERVCLDGLESEALAKALGVDALDAAALPGLPGQIGAALLERLRSLLGIAQRGGKLVSGTEGAKGALKRAPERGGWFAIVATDTSAEIARRLCRTAEAHGVVLARLLTTVEIGQSIGKSPRSIVVIEDFGLAHAAHEIVARLEAVTAPAPPGSDSGAAESPGS